MGYRLEIEKIVKKETIFYGTKLYGYIDENKLPELNSYNFLEAYRYATKDDYWDYGASHQMLMWIRDFREFAKLYKSDYIDYYNEQHEKGESKFTGIEMWEANGWDDNMEIQDILTNEKLDKFDYLILSWN